MKWVAISGGWRKTNSVIEKDVKSIVEDIISNGNCIISGGALGVDYIATNHALFLNPTATLIKIFLPTSLEIYEEHYKKRANEGVITLKQAEDLISQLKKLKKANINSVIENLNNKEVNKDTYYERNTEIVEAADELIAFHINKSQGTQDAINKAEKKRIPIRKFVYTIN